MSKNDVLTVRDLRKVYKGNPPFTAVDDISFSLGKGEILGLLGPNGAGKTTTIQMLISTLKPTSGSIFYFGKDFSLHRSEILQSVAFASTYMSLPWDLSVDRNLDVFGRLYGMNEKELQKNKNELLEKFGILNKKNSQVSSLSAGQVTRLVLTKAFMIRPKIVLLDEPTASLDPDMAKEVVDFVLEQREKEGVSILFTSHNMGEVSAVCDRILFLQQGKIIADDIPDNLAKSAAISKLQLGIGDGMKRTVAIAERLKLPFQQDHRFIELELDEKQIALFLSELAEKGVIYTSINIIQPTLDDYFFKMVKEGKKK